MANASKDATIPVTSGKKRKALSKEKAKGVVTRKHPNRRQADEHSEDEADSSGGDDDLEMDDIGRAPRRSGRNANRPTHSYREGDEDVIDIDIDQPAPSAAENALAAALDAPLALDDAGLLQMEEDDSTPSLQVNSPVVKREQTDEILVVDSDEEPPMQQQEVADDDIQLGSEEEEEKPKPLLQLSYRGFNINGQCLCVVVEPWPPLRQPSREPSLAPLMATASRQRSMTPASTTSVRAQTPLFLPDPDRRSETPAPRQTRVYPPVPLFNQTDETDVRVDEDEVAEAGLMAFSQSLRHGDYAGGAAIDDDELQGAVFFGDADEAREL